MLRKIQIKDLVTILAWRNQKSVRDVMFTDQIIGLEDHLKWWDKVSKDKTQQYFIFQKGNIDYGVVCLTKIDLVKKGCTWGFYFKNLDNNTGLENILLTQSMEHAIIDFCFNRLGLILLTCLTFSFNKIMLKMHKRFGFIETKKYYKIKNNNKELVIEMTLDKQTYLSRQ